MNDYLPTEFNLGQNYPNPFKDKTIIKYCVPYKTNVLIKVYNSIGEEIETLVDEEKKAGTYEIEFKLAVSSRQLANGTYFCRFEAGDFRSEKRMHIIG